MYTSHLKQWGLSKNVNAKDAFAIVHAKRARDSVGKGSQFVVRGERVDPAKMDQYLRRNQSVLDRLAAGDAPSPGSGLVARGIDCQTPSAASTPSPQTPYLAPTPGPQAPYLAPTPRPQTPSPVSTPLPQTPSPAPPPGPQPLEVFEDDLLVFLEDHLKRLSAAPTPWPPASTPGPQGPQPRKVVEETFRLIRDLCGDFNSMTIFWEDLGHELPPSRRGRVIAN